MIGTFQDVKFTLGSFGEQFTKIDGQTYVTYWDAMDPNLRGMSEGSVVEFEPKSAPTLLCSSPHVSIDLPYATVLRVVKGE